MDKELRNKGGNVCFIEYNLLYDTEYRKST